MGSILDYLFHLTELLRETRVVEFSLWVSETAMAQWLQATFIAIPGFQTIHILSIALLFGSVLMLNLKVLGYIGKDQTLAQSFARYQKTIWWGLAALICSGIILLISEPVRNMVNSVFWIKMGFLAIAIVTSLWFQRAVRNNMANWEASPQGHASMRVGAWALIVLWLLVMVGGRWIAYSPN